MRLRYRPTMACFRRMCEENYETAMLCGPELNNSLQHRDHGYSVFRKLKKKNCNTYFHSLGYAQTNTPASWSFCPYCRIYKHCNIGFQKLDSAKI